MSEKARTTESSVVLQLRTSRETGFDVANFEADVSTELQIRDAVSSLLAADPGLRRTQVLGQHLGVDQRLVLGRNSRSPKPHSKSPREIGENVREAF